MNQKWEEIAISCNAHRRFYTPSGTWNIPITPDNLRSIAKKEVDKLKIPSSHNRIYEDYMIQAQIRAIAIRAKPSKRPLKVGDWVYYRAAENRGTKKWPDIIYPVSMGRIVKITEKTCELASGSRVNHEYILGRMSARRSN